MREEFVEYQKGYIGVLNDNNVEILEDDDQFIWSHNHNGTYVIKLGYRALAEEVPQG